MFTVGIVELSAALANYLDAGEHPVAISTGELLGPAVARGLDVGWGRVIGPEASVLLAVTSRRVLVVRRDVGGRLDAVIWADHGPAAIGKPDISGLVLQGAEGAQLVFRPTDDVDVPMLVDALSA